MIRPVLVPIQSAWPVSQLAIQRRMPRRGPDGDETSPGYRPGLSLELMRPSPPRGHDACGHPHDLGVAKEYRKPTTAGNPHPTRQSFGTTRRVRIPGSHLGSTLKPGGAVLTRGVFRRSGSVAYIRVDASPNEVLTRPIIHDGGAPVNPFRVVLPNLYFRAAKTPPNQEPTYLSTSPSSRAMVSMNSSTMSSTTDRVGRTRSSDPTTWPTK